MLILHGRNHAGEKPFKCPTCEKYFTSYGKMVKHVKIHTAGKPYKCEWCEKMFAQRSHLQEHERIHTGDKPYECHTCGKSFAVACTLSMHTRSHTGEKPYKCQSCEKSFSRTSHLKDHMIVHTGEMPYKCQLCKKTFSRAWTLSVHTRLHTGEKQICTKRKSDFKCDLCEKSFPTRYTLKLHATLHIGEKPSDTKVRTERNSDFKCDLCEKSFATCYTLKRHMTAHTGDAYLCETCGKAFPTPSNLLMHVRSHTGERSFVCETCGKSFATKYTLKLHHRVHTGEKPFPCHLCEKAFTQIETWKTHVRLHSGERPFKCKFCAKGFTMSSNLKVHVKKHHGGVLHYDRTKAVETELPDQSTERGTKFEKSYFKAYMEDEKSRNDARNSERSFEKTEKAGNDDDEENLQIGYERRSNAEIKFHRATLENNIGGKESRLDHHLERDGIRDIEENSERNPLFEKRVFLKGGDSEKETIPYQTDVGDERRGSRERNRNDLNIAIRSSDPVDNFNAGKASANEIVGKTDFRGFKFVDYNRKKCSEVKDTRSDKEEPFFILKQEDDDFPVETDPLQIQNETGNRNEDQFSSVKPVDEKSDLFETENDGVNEDSVDSYRGKDTNAKRSPSPVTVKQRTFSKESDGNVGGAEVNSAGNVPVVLRDDCATSCSSTEEQTKYSRSNCPKERSRTGAKDKTFESTTSSGKTETTYLENPFSCNLCGESFSDVGHLGKHVRNHSKEDLFKSHKIHPKPPEEVRPRMKVPSKPEEVCPHVCPLCGKTYPSSGLLARHVATHVGSGDERRYMCDVCGRTFPRPRGLKLHMEIHAATSLSHACEQCGKTFSRPCLLKQHLKRHSERKTRDRRSSAGEPASSGSRPGERSRSKKLCMICNKWFKSMTNHVRTHTGEKPYDCPICEKSFTTGERLRYHVKIHNGERRFECKVCRTSFSHNFRLREHRKLHVAGEEPYKCQNCEASFQTTYELMTHGRIHAEDATYGGTLTEKTLAVGRAGETTFKCQYCCKKLRCSSRLRLHVRICHMGEEPYECQSCEKSFRARNVLSKHVKRCHGNAAPDRPKTPLNVAVTMNQIG